MTDKQIKYPKLAELKLMEPFRELVEYGRQTQQYQCQALVAEVRSDMKMEMAQTQAVTIFGGALFGGVCFFLGLLCYKGLYKIMGGLIIVRRG